MRRRDTWSWMEDVLPFVAMLVITFLDMAVLTIVKTAMNDGMGSFVYVVYHNALGTLILLPFFIVHVLRKVDRPPLTLRALFRFFILGLLGICLFQGFWYEGVYYSSTTIASAILNLSPGITFLIAVFFRMEKIDTRSFRSVAKLLGTMIAISGAMVFTLYQGPGIFHTINSLNQLFLSQPSKWIFGSLISLISATFCSTWIVLQAATTREYPDQQTIVFFNCFFGTIQCMAISPFLERNGGAWMLRSGTRLTAVVLGAIQTTVFHTTIMTWCLRKKGPVFVAMFSPLSIVYSVILGVTFLGDSLHLGSVIGSTIIAVGLYIVIWGQAEDKIKIPVVMDEDLSGSDEPRSSVDHTDPLLSSRNESEC